MMKTIFLITLGLLAMVVRSSGQGPCNCCSNKKIIGPVSPKPGDAVVISTCSTFTVQWKGQPNQAFVFTAKVKNPNKTDTVVINTASNTATINNLNAGMLIKWQIEAVSSSVDGRDFYSYPLKGGKDFLVPKCAAPVAKVREIKSGALKVVGDGKMKIKVYPNPFKSSVSIQFFSSTSAVKVISVFDVNGKIISVHRTARSLTELNARSFTQGTYFIRIHDNEGKLLYNGKVIKD